MEGGGRRAHGFFRPATRRPSTLSEGEPQRKLYLPVRAEADRALDRLAQQPEGRARHGLRVSLTGLQAVRAEHARRVDGRQADVQGRGRQREVRAVEEVEDLRAEFE